ncbi:MAG: type II toxin-antitoxin system VapB family antitoxin [Pseudomonadota bacterium]
MRTTLNLDEQLLTTALEFSDKKEKTAVINAALKAFIEREASRALARAGGSDKKASAGTRNRAWLDAHDEAA